MKVYIAGKITGNPNYKRQFADVERELRAQGHTTVTPAVLPDGFEHHEYMKICFAMIDACDAVYLQENWRDSIGATMERNYAIGTGKVLMVQECRLMDKDTATRLLTAHAICCLPELVCEDCPLWKGYEIDCVGVDNKDLAEAVKVIIEPEEGR